MDRANKLEEERGGKFPCQDRASIPLFGAVVIRYSNRSHQTQVSSMAILQSRRQVRPLLTQEVKKVSVAAVELQPVDRIDRMICEGRLDAAKMAKHALRQAMPGRRMFRYRITCIIMHVDVIINRYRLDPRTAEEADRIEANLREFLRA